MEQYPTVGPNLSRAKHSKPHASGHNHRDRVVEDSPHEEEFDNAPSDVENQKSSGKKNDNSPNFWMYAFAFAAIIVIIILIIWYFWKARNEDKFNQNQRPPQSQSQQPKRSKVDDGGDDDGDDDDTRESRPRDGQRGSKSTGGKNKKGEKKVKFSEENEFLSIMNKQKVDLDAPITKDDDEDGEENGGNDDADEDGDSETASGILSDDEDDGDDEELSIAVPKYLRTVAKRKKNDEYAAKLTAETISLKDLKLVRDNFSCKEFTRFLGTKEVKKFLN